MAAVPDLRRFVLEGERLTILNGLRFALAMNSGIFIFIRAMPDACGLSGIAFLQKES